MTSRCVCGSFEVYESIQSRFVNAGVKTAEVKVPVLTCKICKLAFTDSRADKIHARALQSLRR